MFPFSTNTVSQFEIPVLHGQTNGSHFISEQFTQLNLVLDN